MVKKKNKDEKPKTWGDLVLENGKTTNRLLEEILKQLKRKV